MSAHDIGTEYFRVVNDKFAELKRSAEKAIAQVLDDKLNWSLNEDSNSIAVIVHHMSGNMISRWTNFLDSDGEKEGRDRDSEFEGTVASREELLDIWNRGWGVFLQALGSLGSGDLLRTVYIREKPHSVLEAIERQMSHYSSHIGQIIYIAKQIQSDAWETLTIPRRKN
uniref:DUF1572 family protein n=1 Tax=Paenibacillus terrae TaxID=159743 RepID=UPI00119DEF37|nr:DUF1572 family protein [Paenibacillus terrae]